jgi:hypothetical protein
MERNETDAVRAARPKGKECRHLNLGISISEVSIFFMNDSGTWMIQETGLFTGRGYCSGKDVVREAYLRYVDRAITMPML